MHIQFAELAVFDQDRAKAFYVSRFDCSVIADQPIGNSGWRWIELRLPGAVTNLHFVQRGNDDRSAGPVLVLVDEDVEATVQALESRGVEFVTAPMPAPYDPNRLVAEFYDSEGNRIVISSQ